MLHCFFLLTNAGLFTQSGIDIEKLLTEKKEKRNFKLKRKQEKEKKQAQKETKEAKKEEEKEVRRTNQHPVSKFSNDRFKLMTVFLQKMKDSQVSIEMNKAKLFTGPDEQNGTASYMTAKLNAKWLGKGRDNWAYQRDAADSDSDLDGPDDAISSLPAHADGEKGMTHASGTHSIILDISTTNFVDTVTVKTFKNVSVPGTVSLSRRLVRKYLHRALLRYYESLFINNSGKRIQPCFILSDI